jgi:hypothetical protein
MEMLINFGAPTRSLILRQEQRHHFPPRAQRVRRGLIRSDSRRVRHDFVVRRTAQ